jgi:UDP-N-acetylmuramyl pentapeptide phosphotransferase/UDP-N-acetylglucosamine-1-phosphate transferase
MSDSVGNSLQLIVIDRLQNAHQPSSIHSVWGDEITRAVMCCGIVVITAEPLIIPLLRRLAAIDTPSLRSSHTVPTPRGGGLPIVVGLLVAVALIRGTEAVPLGAAIGFFGALGFVDDLRSLTAVRRLRLQCVGSGGIAALLILPLRLPGALLPVLTLLAAVWLMGFVNAFNFMDGVNGISGAHAVIAGVAYACFGQWRQDPFLVGMGLAVAVGALAFLPWNAVRARVFLGDVGSYALGAALAVLAVTAVIHGVPPEAALGPLALYLADTAWTLQRRVRAGERWTEAHRTHTYQRWCDVGWTHQEVTLATAATTILVSLLGAMSLTGNLPVRLSCDLSGLLLLAVYLGSPALFGHPGPSAQAALRELPRAQEPASRLREGELQRELG